MKNFFILGILFILFNSSINQTLTKEQIEEALKRNKEQSSKSKIPNLIIIKFKQERKNDMRMFGKIILEFLSTIGVSANIGDMKDLEMILTFQRDKHFDKDVLLNNFKDVLESVDVADFTKNGDL